MNSVLRAATRRRRFAVVPLLIVCGVLQSAEWVRAEALQVHRNDSIVILGNTFAERMQRFGYFETFLHSRFPQHRLRIRNMGWSADEVDRMIRPQGFPKLIDELHAHEADLIFVCFGMNESYRGRAGVGRFRKELSRFVQEFQKQQFNGASSPRIVLVSPIAHEKLEGGVTEHAPTSRDRHNRSLQLYSQTIATIADALGAKHVDLFGLTSTWMTANSGKPLTMNGIHLTEYGDWVVSRMMAHALGLSDVVSAPTALGDPRAERLRRAVYEKNFRYESWWHPPNSSYIHGRRNEAPGSKHLQHERILRLRLVDACDRAIWAAAKPDPAHIWQKAPIEGEPIWHPTPPDKPVPDVEQQPQLSIRSDGDADPHIRSPDEQLNLFRVPEGYEVNLFASEVRFPIANPMAIQFDAQGRLWVANTPTWPHSLPGRQPEDSIVILEDVNRDGVADRHTVFLKNMNLIHGFGLGNGGAYVAQAPYLILARDTDADGKADWLQTVLHGFGAEDAEHAMNNFSWSPGGTLYFTQGIFYHTQVETPEGPVRARDAAVFRYQPYAQRFGVYVSHHFWNPYGNTFDRWGRGIVLDASAGQYYPMDVLSANYVYPKQKARTDHLSFAPGGSIAAGCAMLRTRHFPREVQGRFLVNHCEGDVGTHWYTLKAHGTLYRAERHVPSLLTSTDRTFRPVAMAIGPDGALYVADFYSHIFENVNFSKRHPGRDHAHGRIWRISHKSRPGLDPPPIVGRPVPELLNLLKAHEDTTREFARRELQQRGYKAVLGHLAKWIAALDANAGEFEHHLTEALWVHQSLDVVDVALLERLLSAHTAEARMAATQVLRFQQHRIEGSLAMLRKRIDDPDPRVRLHAVLACGFDESDKAAETALEAAGHKLDPGLKHALDQTLNSLERRQRARENR